MRRSNTCLRQENTLINLLMSSSYHIEQSTYPYNKANLPALYVFGEIKTEQSIGPANISGASMTLTDDRAHLVVYRPSEDEYVKAKTCIDGRDYDEVKAELNRTMRKKLSEPSVQEKKVHAELSPEEFWASFLNEDIENI